MAEKTVNIERLYEEINYYKKKLDEFTGSNLKNEYIISGLRHRLNQKSQGFAILSELQQSIGLQTPLSSIFETTICSINTILEMDKSAVLTPTSGENTYKLSYWFGFEKSSFKQPVITELKFPSDFFDSSSFLLVNKSSTTTPLIETIQSSFDLPYFICLPILVDHVPIGLLISGRFTESRPFRPPLDRGDVDTLNSIIDLISNSIKKKQLEPPPCDDRLIWDVWLSVYHLPALTVALDIGLFTLVAKRSATAEEIAKSLSLKTSAVEALVAVLTSLGFLVLRHGRFSITEVSRYFLLPESPYYWGELLCTYQGRLHTRILKALEKSKSPVSSKKDLPIFDQWKTGQLDPEVAKLFTQAMHSHSFPTSMGAVRRGDFTGVKRLLDAAGGSGSFCIAFALRHPETRFTILDLPPVAKIAEKYVAKYGLQDQIDIYAADMLRDPWPTGHDAVFFSDIFHDWDREACIYLSQRSFEILPPGGRIYIHEMLLEDTQDGPLTTASYAIAMLVTTKGKQFTASELDDLLRECGFVDVSVTPTYSYYSLVSARKP